MSDRSLAKSRRRLIVATAAAAFLPFSAAHRCATAARGGGWRPAARSRLLATVYAGQVAPALCLVSEKYDGVRALWDGRVLRHRSGRAVAAPRSFLAALPSEPLDGELWLGRGRFEALSAIVRTTSPSGGRTGRESATWCSSGPAAAAPSLSGRCAWPTWRRHRATPSWSRRRRSGSPTAPRSMRRLESVVAAGGEGLMLHLAAAPVACRPQRPADEAEAASRCRSGRRRDPAGRRQVPRRWSARSRSRPPTAGAFWSAAASATRSGTIRPRSGSVDHLPLS